MQVTSICNYFVIESNTLLSLPQRGTAQDNNEDSSRPLQSLIAARWCSPTCGLEAAADILSPLPASRTPSDWYWGKDGGAKWDFIASAEKPGRAHFVKSENLTSAKSNQRFWGLTTPILQRRLPLTSPAQFKAFNSLSRGTLSVRKYKMRRRSPTIHADLIASPQKIHHCHLKSSFSSKEGFCWTVYKHGLQLSLVFCYEIDTSSNKSINHFIAHLAGQSTTQQWCVKYHLLKFRVNIQLAAILLTSGAWGHMKKWLVSHTMKWARKCILSAHYRKAHCYAPSCVNKMSFDLNGRFSPSEPHFIKQHQAASNKKVLLQNIFNQQTRIPVQVPLLSFPKT